MCYEKWLELLNRHSSWHRVRAQNYSHSYTSQQKDAECSPPHPSVGLARTLLQRGSCADGCVSKPPQIHDSSLWRWPFWRYPFFTEQNSLVSNDKRQQELLFVSLSRKILTPLHFEAQTDGSLMHELLGPRPVGVAAVALAPWVSAGPAGRARAALGKRLCVSASADSAASVQGWLFVGGTKSGYYFKRNSHRKNVGFKINKCAHGSQIKV